MVNRKRRDKFLRQNIFQKNCRGQFFLIAAIIIIVVTVGIVTVSNYTQEKESVKLYDLGEELGIESQNVLDYGTYSQLDEEEMKMLMENFIKNYVDYIGDTGNLYFIFGNKQKIYVVGYQELTNETVCITLNPATDPNAECIPLQILGETQEFPAGSQEIEWVFITIESYEYQFKLNPGENFYFVIWQRIGREKIVIRSTDV
jgi:hypothetical protein